MIKITNTYIVYHVIDLNAENVNITEEQKRQQKRKSDAEGKHLGRANRTEDECEKERRQDLESSGKRRTVRSNKEAAEVKKKDAVRKKQARTVRSGTYVAKALAMNSEQTASQSYARDDD